MPVIPHGHQPEPIAAVLGRLRDECQQLQRRQQRRSKRRNSSSIGQQRPRSAGLLAKTPLGSAWPQHQPRPRSAAAAARSRAKSVAARGDVPGGRISTSQLREGHREQREEGALRHERLRQYDETGCVWRHLREQQSFSSTATPRRFSFPPPRTKAATRAAELLCLQVETRAALRLQRCWRRRQRTRRTQHYRRLALMTRAVHLKIDEAKLDLSQVFRQLDADNSGDVSYGELRDGLRRMGVAALTEEEFSLLVQLLDQDGDGTIDRTEFAVLLEHNVLSSTDAFGAMAACRSLGGFRIVEGVPQGFLQYEAAFVVDPRQPTCNGRRHYSNPNGCHLYFGDDGCWVLNRRFTPKKTMEMHGYLRNAEADKAKLLYGVEEWSPAFKRPLVWRWRVAGTYYDVTLVFRYEAVIPYPKRRPQGNKAQTAVVGGTIGAGSISARAGPEAVLRTSLYEESMALTWRPTGRACWQDRAPAAPTPAAVTARQERSCQHKRKQSGKTAVNQTPKRQPHRTKAGGLPKPRKARTDGPRGREAILFRHNCARSR